MGGQQTSEDTDSDFENLWSCVHVERDGPDDILDRSIKPLDIAHDHKRIKGVD